MSIALVLAASMPLYYTPILLFAYLLITIICTRESAAALLGILFLLPIHEEALFLVLGICMIFKDKKALCCFILILSYFFLPSTMFTYAYLGVAILSVLILRVEYIPLLYLETKETMLPYRGNDNLLRRQMQNYAGIFQSLAEYYEGIHQTGAELLLNMANALQYNAEEIQKMADCCKYILVVEDGQPFVEEQVKALLSSDYTVKGRLTGDLPRTGELTPDNVGNAIGWATKSPFVTPQVVMPRPPALCQGCGHRDVYDALNKVAAEYPGARIFGDIGCYTLGALPPFRAIDSCVDMGASITMAKGAADAGVFPAISVIGDSTFTHSGMTGLLDAVNDKANITIIISDNLTTAMTGGQDSAGTNKFEAICLGLGVEPEHVRVVVPLPKNMEEITRIIREEIEYKGVSVIIPRRECVQTLNRKLRQKRVEKA